MSVQSKHEIEVPDGGAWNQGEMLREDDLIPAGGGRISMPPHHAFELPLHFRTAPCETQTLSWWTGSRAKRIFDVAVVLAFVPLLVPLLAAVAMAVMLCCGRPILFRQRRAGLFGRAFVIYKFRTMHHVPSGRSFSIAAHVADDVTVLGRFLRRSKLDELPQAWNVLIGDMSLVGPRPKVPSQQLFPLECRPGLTGPATLAFAREEQLFSGIPREKLDAYYRKVILPAKQRLDSQYSAGATMVSDLYILLLTAFVRWQGNGLNHGATANLDHFNRFEETRCEPPLSKQSSFASVSR